VLRNTLCGFRVRHIGFDIAGKAIVGRVVQSRPSSGGWIEEISGYQKTIYSRLDAGQQAAS
jgi:hypothetical protein